MGDMSFEKKIIFYIILASGLFSLNVLRDYVDAAELYQIVSIWFVKMFTTTNHIFAVSTTWQYMLIIPFILFVMLFAIVICLEFFGKRLPDVIGYALVILFLILEGIGVLFYCIALIKFMWASA